MATKIFGSERITREFAYGAHYQTHFFNRVINGKVFCFAAVYDRATGVLFQVRVDELGKGKRHSFVFGN